MTLYEIAMANTYTQIYIHAVFAVKGRQNLLKNPWRQEVFKYIAGIIEGKGQKSIIVNGVADHVHIFVGLKPTIAVSDLLRDVKNSSSKFINEQKFLPGKFEWQEGFGAFSYANSQVEQVYQYILNQEEHHRTKTFKEEYFAILEKFQVEFDDKYVFDWIE